MCQGAKAAAENNKIPVAAEIKSMTPPIEYPRYPRDTPTPQNNCNVVVSLACYYFPVMSLVSYQECWSQHCSLPTQRVPALPDTISLLSPPLLSQSPPSLPLEKKNRMRLED